MDKYRFKEEKCARGYVCHGVTRGQIRLRNYLVSDYVTKAEIENVTSIWCEKFAAPDDNVIPAGSKRPQQILIHYVYVCNDNLPYPLHSCY